MKKFEFARRALNDLREIWEFVSQDSFDALISYSKNFIELSNNLLKCH